MEPLRHADRLARLVLAWFVFVVGVAAMSPVLHPVRFDSICSAAGPAQAVVHPGEADASSGPHLDCPLCVPTGAPPPVHVVGAPVAPSGAPSVDGVPSERISASTAAPLPARGPPAAFEA